MYHNVFSLVKDIFYIFGLITCKKTITVKTFKKQHSTLKRNELKTILGGILPNQCLPRLCRELCKDDGGGGCDSNGLCLCGPFPNPNDL
ncbi:hypothetical protein M2372_004406 [Chryseobacterium sp. BIGb0232]|nr:hypothetical protein [Chryseobacterium sp. BIGb0232]ROS09651.1 hypothetical protein EDF65_4390 [Chryseobacterium nakagawai]